jgi:hypothetical protein
VVRSCHVYLDQRCGRCVKRCARCEKCFTQQSQRTRNARNTYNNLGGPGFENNYGTITIFRRSRVLNFKDK